MNCKMKFRVGMVVLFLLIGILAIVYGITIESEASAFITGFGSGLGGTALILMIKIILDYKNPKKAKELEIEENDERNIKIITNSYALSFRVCLLLQALACIIATFMKEVLLAESIAAITGIEMLIFIVIYMIESKKN